ncbi:MAG TPA: hypothetical protein VGQ86_08250, partial [Candidatus Limnocylindria bacterium]|nr:hypothetical protein [Candidatus Limnocylindria bacterium]
ARLIPLSYNAGHAGFLGVIGYLRAEMGKGKLRIAIPLSAAWLLLAVYASLTTSHPFDLVATTAVVTSPAIGWTWHWVMEKPS